MEISQDGSIMVIFGATGDLAVHYLFPALLRLEQAGLLAQDLRIVPVSRRPWDTAQYKKWLEGQITKQEPAWRRFAKRLSYVEADFARPSSFEHLSKFLKDVDEAGEHMCFNRLFYYAVEPKFFEPLSGMLKQSGLLTSCSKHNRLTRVLIEKPFGNDLKSAVRLNSLLSKYFSEEQIYRIDHYLGKETVQNLLVARFANVFFEPVWNNRFIERVEIDVFEEEGVGERIEFYNQTGALKDVVQNHMLNILAVLAMEKPKDFSAASIRKEKAKALSLLIPETAKTVSRNVMRAQYAAGPETSSFLQEGGQKDIETYVALKACVNSGRFRGVPFIMRTGKRLSHKHAEVRVVFKKVGEKLFGKALPFANVVTFRIQPEERVGLTVNNKVPGFGMTLHPADLDFSYSAFKKKIPSAYERLLLDFIQADQRLYLDDAEVTASWKYIDSIIKHWKKVPMGVYMPFSEGPAAPF